MIGFPINVTAQIFHTTMQTLVTSVVKLRHRGTSAGGLQVHTAAIQMRVIRLTVID